MPAPRLVFAAERHQQFADQQTGQIRRVKATRLRTAQRGAEMLVSSGSPRQKSNGRRTYDSPGESVAITCAKITGKRLACGGPAPVPPGPDSETGHHEASRDGGHVIACFSDLVQRHG